MEQQQLISRETVLRLFHKILGPFVQSFNYFLSCHRLKPSDDYSGSFREKFDLLLSGKSTSKNFAKDFPKLLSDTISEVYSYPKGQFITIDAFNTKLKNLQGTIEFVILTVCKFSCEEHENHDYYVKGPIETYNSKIMIRIKCTGRISQNLTDYPHLDPSESRTKKVQFMHILPELFALYDSVEIRLDTNPPNQVTEEFLYF